jgi:hypothetical protein
MPRNKSVEPLTPIDISAFDLPALAQKWMVSVPFLRLEIRRGHLRALRLGRRVLVAAEEARRYLAANQSAEIDAR